MSRINYPKHSPVHVPPAAAKVLDLLPDVEGGQVNLLPLSALSSPVRVLVPQWPNGSPTAGLFDHVELVWGGTVVDDLSIDFAGTDEQRTLFIPLADLTHGNTR